jgi:hypothetical protein|nr:MAG TPA: hypothetical protein [Caudoviricetes sp.]
MTIEEFANKLWEFVLPKVREFIRENSFDDLEIEIFLEDLNKEADTFCELNGFKKEFTFEASYRDGVFSITPTHIGYKNKINYLEE